MDQNITGECKNFVEGTSGGCSFIFSSCLKLEEQQMTEGYYAHVSQKMNCLIWALILLKSKDCKALANKSSYLTQ